MQHLKVLRFTKNGAYLIDDDKREVLLPNRYITPEVTLNSLVWVFVYTDSDDRIVATTTIPKGFLGDILPLEIVDIVNNGIYLDLGILKDIFMPSKNPNHFHIGQKVVVKLVLDKQKRIIARQNLQDYLLPLKCDSKLKNVEILPFLKTDIGFNCVVNKKYFGIIHNNDINQKILIGEPIKGIIKKIRSDGKIDLGLSVNIDNAKLCILNALDKNNNVLNVDFHSNCEDINKILGISKKAFKTASNALVKENKIGFIKDSSSKFVLTKLK